MNRATLIGHLGKDPEIRSTEGGHKICNFSLATSERWKDKNTGEKKEQTEWHRIVVFNEKLIDVIDRFVKKGAKVLVEGQIRTRKWEDQAGQPRYSTEIVIGQFNGQLTLLDKIEGRSAGADRSLDNVSPESYGQTRSRDQQTGIRDYQAPLSGQSRDRWTDDQIPF